MMPLGGGSERGDAMAELALHIHTLKTSPHLGDNLALAAQEALTSEQHANLGNAISVSTGDSSAG